MTNISTARVNLINGTVKRFERGDMIIDLGNNLEAIVPQNEQSRGEMWNQGERIRVAHRRCFEGAERTADQRFACVVGVAQTAF